MKKAKYILRVIFLLLTVLLLISLNRNADDRTESVAEFKIKIIQKLRMDSLDNRHKVDILLNETTKFLDSLSRARTQIDYLMLLFGFWGAVEFVFLILVNRNYGRQEIR